MIEIEITTTTTMMMMMMMMDMNWLSSLTYLIGKRQFFDDAQIASETDTVNIKIIQPVMIAEVMNDNNDDDMITTTTMMDLKLLTSLKMIWMEKPD